MTYIFSKRLNIFFEHREHTNIFLITSRTHLQYSWNVQNTLAYYWNIQNKLHLLENVQNTLIQILETSGTHLFKLKLLFWKQNSSTITFSWNVQNTPTYSWKRPDYISTFSWNVQNISTEIFRIETLKQKDGASGHTTSLTILRTQDTAEDWWRTPAEVCEISYLSFRVANSTCSICCVLLELTDLSY